MLAVKATLVAAARTPDPASEPSTPARGPKAPRVRHTAGARTSSHPTSTRAPEVVAECAVHRWSTGAHSALIATLAIGVIKGAIIALKAASSIPSSEPLVATAPPSRALVPIASLRPLTTPLRACGIASFIAEGIVEAALTTAKFELR